MASPTNWVTEISEGSGRVPEQPGPYRLWEHAHRFREDGDGTIVEDKVGYALPFWPLGEVFHPLWRLQLERIFRFRQSAVRRYLLHR